MSESINVCSFPDSEPDDREFTVEQIKSVYPDWVMPTDAMVENAYSWDVRRRVIYGNTMSESSDRWLNVAEFKVWLAEHDRQVKAEAWDEGYDVGYDDCRDGGMGLRNPYREAATE